MGSTLTGRELREPAVGREGQGREGLLGQGAGRRVEARVAEGAEQEGGERLAVDPPLVERHLGDAPALEEGDEDVPAGALEAELPGLGLEREAHRGARGPRREGEGGGAEARRGRGSLRRRGGGGGTWLPP